MSDHADSKHWSESPIAQFLVINIVVLAIGVPIYFQVQKSRARQGVEQRLENQAEQLVAATESQLDDPALARGLALELFARQNQLGDRLALDDARREVEKFRAALADPDTRERILSRLVSRIRRKRKHAEDAPRPEPRTISLRDAVDGVEALIRRDLNASH